MTTLSHSQLETWQTCQARWKYAYLDQLPEVPQEALVLGKAVHASIEADNRTRLAGQAPLTQEALTALAGQTLEEEAGDLLALRLLAMKARATALLSVYARQVQPLFQPLSVESAFRFPLPDHSGWFFTGRIDALMQDGTGQRVIVDYKTANRAWERGKEHRNQQADAYVWALKQAGEEVPVVVFIPLIASAGPGGYTARMELRKTRRGPQAISAYQSLIGAVIGQMEEASASGSYPARPGWYCRWCPYQAACPAQTGTTSGLDRTATGGTNDNTGRAAGGAEPGTL